MSAFYLTRSGYLEANSKMEAYCNKFIAGAPRNSTYESQADLAEDAGDWSHPGKGCGELQDERQTVLQRHPSGAGEAGFIHSTTYSLSTRVSSSVCEFSLQ